MKKVLFICHGNICRSPAAQIVFRDLVTKAGTAGNYHIESRATSTEELGNPLYPPMRRALAQHGYALPAHTARQITAKDCAEYDYLIIMDSRNRRGLVPFLGNNENKVSLLMEWAGESREVSDPWYSGDHEGALRDIEKGCRALFEALEKR